ncbi:ABC transporter substrate-binding protein [Paenibacillus sp. GXUN7292]|uniref:ABC transporter substrate-binding protein n=1 Tax=Paenibacillus sp. GXUN7292 TaxID=3422499 RepID=UPI003D7EA685
MKKSLTYLLTVCLIFSLVLAACAKNEPKPQTPAAGSEGQSKPPAEQKEKELLTPPGTYPIVNEKVTLKVMVRGNPLVEDFATNEFTKWYEEKTNVHIEWEVVPEQSRQEKLNLALTSNDYPDIIFGINVSAAQQMIFGSQGIFLPLNDLIEEQGVQTKKLFADSPLVKETITAPDGNIYALPDINECYHCSMSQKMWIYEPWLKEVGLDMPTTTEEFYEVLKAFKEKDPNKNGKPDEVPLAFTPKSWRSSIEAFLLNSFVYNPMLSTSTKYLYINEDGKVDASFNKPGWKEGLEYMNRLYKEGLIAPESFTQDENQLIQLGENPGEVILGASAGGHQGVFTQLMGESGRWSEYKTVPPLLGPSGVQYAAYDPLGMTVGSFIITDKAKYPEVALRWADGLYEFEHTLRSNYGRPGEEWREAEAGEIGINGKPAQWSELKSFGTVQNVNYAQTGPGMRSNDFRLSAVAKGEDDLEVILYNETKNKYEPYAPTKVKTLPPLFFTEEQASEVADLAKTLYDFVEEMTARFVIGDADLNKEWDSYLKTLNDMNLNRYLELYQQTYDANK